MNAFGMLLLMSTPATIFLFFVRKQVIKAWSIFALLYMFFGVFFILKQDDYSGGLPVGISDQSYYAISLAMGFTAVTLFWAIIHTLILRHKEKKAGQTMIK